MKRAGLVILLMIFSGLMITAKGDTKYKPDWESLDSRPIPEWFDDAKFGIFIHWGVYSVPAHGPRFQYAEHYLRFSRNPLHPTFWRHRFKYGLDFKYEDFAPSFTAENYRPDQWADLFSRSGAKYVVLTSKHHDGFCLYPSQYSPGWNSMDTGPRRDLLGDLTDAVRDKGLIMGYYYSLLEWNDFYKNDFEHYVDTHYLPQIKELVTNYKPDIIFADGEWDHYSEEWKSPEFLAWLYNESAVRDYVVVNDRWGKDTRSKHGGYYTTEYGGVTGPEGEAARHKWEENRGIGYSYGYNANEPIGDYKTGPELIRMLVTIVANGGNFLLNVGPTAKGEIPDVMAERLLEIGKWLDENGQAIYATKPWAHNSEGEDVFFTMSKDEKYLYAHCFKNAGSEFKSKLVKPRPGSLVSLLGADETLEWSMDNGTLTVIIDEAALRIIDPEIPWVLRFEI